MAVILVCWHVRRATSTGGENGKVQRVYFTPYIGVSAMVCYKHNGRRSRFVRERRGNPAGTGEKNYAWKTKTLGA